MPRMSGTCSVRGIYDQAFEARAHGSFAYFLVLLRHAAAVVSFPAQAGGLASVKLLRGQNGRCRKGFSLLGRPSVEKHFARHQIIMSPPNLDYILLADTLSLRTRLWHIVATLPLYGCGQNPLTASLALLGRFRSLDGRLEKRLKPCYLAPALRAHRPDWHGRCRKRIPAS